MLKRKEKSKEQVMAAFEKNVKLKRRLRKMCIIHSDSFSIRSKIWR